MRAQAQGEKSLPLHGRFDFDNYNTPGTADYRLNFAAQYNNLWLLDHQIGLSDGFTPQAFKSPGLMTDYFFNRPLISYYGAFYRMPFASPKLVQQQIGNSANFGYDEATRQLRLPPGGSRPDFSFYASGSSGDAGVKCGPRTLVTQTPLLTIESQDSGQNLTINGVLSGRLSLPLIERTGLRLSFSGGADYRH